MVVRFEAATRVRKGGSRTPSEVHVELQWPCSLTTPRTTEQEEANPGHGRISVVGYTCWKVHGAKLINERIGHFCRVSRRIRCRRKVRRVSVVWLVTSILVGGCDTYCTTTSSERTLHLRDPWQRKRKVEAATGVYIVSTLNIFLVV